MRAFTDRTQVQSPIVQFHAFQEGDRYNENDFKTSSIINDDNQFKSSNLGLY